MEGLRLASAGDDVKFWDCCGGFSLIHAYNPHCNRNIASLSWNSEGSLLASCALEDEQVVLTYMKNSILNTIELQCGTGVQCIDFSSTSRLLLCGGAEGVSVWDLKTKALKKSFQEHKGPVTAARYNWNNSYIASGSEAGHVILHNTVTGQSSSPLLAPHVQAVRQLEYSAFKKSMFGTASDDGAITLWDANTRRALHSFKDAHNGPATGLAFSPINEMLMMSVGLDKRVVCYDIQKKQIVKVIDVESPLTCIDVMPDGATAAVGSTRGKIYIYDLRQGGNAPVHIFQAHKTSVRSVKFMPTAKLKADDSSGGKAGMSTMSLSSGSRRQLPSAPTVMQDITPRKTGQTSDVDPATFGESSGQTIDIFSPAAQENHSQHSKSASHLNLTNSHGEDSCTDADVFSPLIKGAAELSAASQPATRDSSLFSMFSFLGQNNSNVHSPVAGHVSFSNLSNNASSSAQLSHPHASSTLHSPAVGWGQEHTDSGHLPVAAAGLRSHLHHSGLAPSPLAGPLLRPQLSSSLQTSGTDHFSHGQASSHSQSSLGPGQLSEQAPVRLDTSHPMVNGHVTFQVSDAQSMARASASLDSAAISGGEDGESESGLSPKRDASCPPAVTTHHSMHPLNADSGGSTAAGPVDVGAASDAGVTQREFLKSLVTDAMEDFRDDFHRDIQGLHVAMLRQFHNFEREIQSTLSHYADMNHKLLLYVRQLEEENRRLKKNY